MLAPIYIGYGTRTHTRNQSDLYWRKHCSFNSNSRIVSSYYWLQNKWFDLHNSGPKGCENAIPISICKSISFICGVKCLSTSKGRGRLLIRLGNSATLGPLANAYLMIEMRQMRQFSNLSNLILWKIIGSGTPLLQYLPFEFAKELQRSLFAYPIILIRCALNGQWLMSLTRSLTQWSDINGHYHDDCLLRSNETFTNYLSQIVEKFKFKLDLENFAFLDTNWERPIFRSHQLVPCKDLGLMVCAVEG